MTVRDHPKGPRDGRMQRLMRLDAVARLARARRHAVRRRRRRHRAGRDEPGWTDLAERGSTAAAGAPPSSRPRRPGDGVTDVVLLGMGGSLARLARARRRFSASRALPTLHVLDTTSPRTVDAALGDARSRDDALPRVEQVRRHDRAELALRDLPRGRRRSASAARPRASASSPSPTRAPRSRRSPPPRASAPSSPRRRPSAAASRR